LSYFAIHKVTLLRHQAAIKPFVCQHKQAQFIKLMMPLQEISSTTRQSTMMIWSNCGMELRGFLRDVPGWA